MSVHVPKCPGILEHRDTIRTFSDIINGHGKCSTFYSASVRVIVKLAFILFLHSWKARLGKTGIPHGAPSMSSP